MIRKSISFFSARAAMMLLALMLCANQMMAVPAHPKAVKVQQPDGSYLTIRLCGDEWMHFTTTDDGYSVVKDSRGYYVYAELKGGELKATPQVAHDAAERMAGEQSFVRNLQKYQAPAMSERQADMKRKVQKRQQQTLTAQRTNQYDYTNFKGLIVLIEFNDKQFSRPDFYDILNNMVNQENYTGYTDVNGQPVACTGSVHDYYSDNSGAKFQPQFDVVGPYMVNYSQYDGGNQYIQIINAALDAADDDVNFKEYDGDGDNYVDLVFFIIAGNGANYGGNNGNLWWPHRSIVYDPNTYYLINKDNVYFYDYASSVELYGWTDYPNTVHIDGIGTICHEFSHVLGLPDFYDSNYGTDGQSNHPGDWSVMAGGCYLNDSRTPVGYSLYERYSVGFTNEPTVIDMKGSYTLEPLYSSQTGFRINSQDENEFFLFENRQKDAYKWDAYLPGSGMLVHRVDLTDQSVWDSNLVNAYSDHNYYVLVRAGGAENSGSAYDVFPGTAVVTELNNETSPANLRSWAGQDTKFGLTNIGMSNDGIITFDTTVEIYDAGDVNGNGKIDIGDAVSVVNYLVSKPSEVFIESVADLNGNEQIDIGDAVMIVNIIVGKDK